MKGSSNTGVFELQRFSADGPSFYTDEGLAKRYQTPGREPDVWFEKLNTEEIVPSGVVSRSARQRNKATKEAETWNAMPPEERKASVAEAAEIDRLQSEHRDMQMVIILTGVTKGVCITAKDAKVVWRHPYLLKDSTKTIRYRLCSSTKRKAQKNTANDSENAGNSSSQPATKKVKIVAPKRNPQGQLIHDGFGDPYPLACLAKLWREAMCKAAGNAALDVAKSENKTAKEQAQVYLPACKAKGKELRRIQSPVYQTVCTLHATTMGVNFLPLFLLKFKTN